MANNVFANDYVSANSVKSYGKKAKFTSAFNNYMFKDNTL